MPKAKGVGYYFDIKVVTRPSMRLPDFFWWYEILNITWERIARKEAHNFVVVQSINVGGYWSLMWRECKQISMGSTCCTRVEERFRYVVSSIDKKQKETQRAKLGIFMNRIRSMRGGGDFAELWSDWLWSWRFAVPNHICNTHFLSARCPVTQFVEFTFNIVQATLQLIFSTLRFLKSAH